MASLSRPGMKKADEMIRDAGGDPRSLTLFPTRLEEDHISSLMQSLPAHHHDLVWEVAKHISNTQYRAMAAAAGALVAQELFEPNSSFGMWAAQNPAGVVLGRGANATPGTIYNFASYMGGALRPNGGQVTFTRGQRFFGLTTGNADSANGWTFVGNSVMLQSDAISGIETDSQFVNWTPSLVKARMIKGEYEGFAIRSETVIGFTASAYIPAGMPAAPSNEGLSVLFWDSRCLNKELPWLDLDTMSFPDMVTDIVARMEGGKINRRLLTDFIPAHLRNGRG